MASDPAHWERVWSTKAANQVSWYQDEPRLSLQLIEAAGVRAGQRVVDVGGGASPLAARLAARGVAVTVVDIAAAALEQARRRLPGGLAGELGWLQADVTRDPIAGPFDIWHDRAVFHFLTQEQDRAAYARAAAAAVPVGGHAVVATFAPSGPERCSGLPVRRHSPEEIQSAMGPGWQLVRAQSELHRTPGGGEQAFVYALLRRC